jgi:hypothetical protein
MDSKEQDLQDISKAVMATYHDEIHKFINSKAAGTLTDADVIIMIMNVTISISTNIYYSLKQILPTTPMDFNFMKAKLSNSLIDSFEKIKQFNPKENMMPLTVEQVKEIKYKGYTIITMQDGSERKITEDQLMIKREDAAPLIEGVRKETISANTPKIITPGNIPLRR